MNIITKITNKAFTKKSFENFSGKIISALSALAIINASAYSGYIAAQSQATIEEVVVTSRKKEEGLQSVCLLYTSPSPRDTRSSRMPSSA